MVWDSITILYGGSVSSSEWHCVSFSVRRPANDAFVELYVGGWAKVQHRTERTHMDTGIDRRGGSVMWESCKSVVYSTNGLHIASAAEERVVVVLVVIELTRIGGMGT